MSMYTLVYNIYIYTFCALWDNGRRQGGVFNKKQTSATACNVVMFVLPYSVYWQACYGIDCFCENFSRIAWLGLVCVPLAGLSDDFSSLVTKCLNWKALYVSINCIQIHVALPLSTNKFNPCFTWTEYIHFHCLQNVKELLAHGISSSAINGSETEGCNYARYDWFVETL